MASSSIIAEGAGSVKEFDHRLGPPPLARTRQQRRLAQNLSGNQKSTQSARLL